MMFQGPGWYMLRFKSTSKDGELKMGYEGRYVDSKEELSKKIAEAIKRRTNSKFANCELDSVKFLGQNAPTYYMV